MKLSEWKLKISDTGVFSTMEKLTGAADKAAGKMGKMQAGLDKFTGGLKAAASEVPGLNQVLSLVTNPYTAVAAGIAAVGAAAVNATSMAMSFEKGMSQINTTARLSRPELDALRNQLLTMGADSTVSLSEIPAAYNQIISAVGNAGDAMKIFTPALQAAQAGFTDMRTVGDAAANVLGATSQSASHATEVYDMLFAAVRQGKGEFADFANYLPKIIPLSQTLGVAYKEVAGSFALLTSKGNNADYATTLLTNAFTALSKSEVIHGTKSKLGFERSGIAIHDRMGKMRALADIVDDLARKTQGMTDKQRQNFLAGLGLDAQASSLFSILAQNAAENRQFVEATTNSAGEMAAAYERSLSPSDKMKKLWNQYDLIMVKIGYKILPYVNKGLEYGLSFVEKIKANSEPIAEYFGAAVAPVRLLWSGLKGTYNLLTSISDMMGGGTMGSLIEQLFGGTGKVWPTIKEFLGKFFASVNVALQAVDDVSEGNFRQAATRFTDFQAKLRSDESMKTYETGKAADFMKTLGLSYMQPAANLLPYVAGQGAFGSLPPGGGKKPPGKPGGVEMGIKTVNDGGRQQRNVTVNIQSLVKELKVMAGTVEKSGAQLEEFIKETLIRAVSGAEQALQN